MVRAPEFELLIFVYVHTKRDDDGFVYLIQRPMGWSFHRLGYISGRRSRRKYFFAVHVFTCPMSMSA